MKNFALGTAPVRKGQAVIVERLRYHLPKLARSLGRKARIGDRHFAASGYHADRFAFDTGDEPHMVPVFRRVLERDPGAVLDVGANCGQTLVKVLSIDPGRAYFGFEPQIECCYAIFEFKAANRLENVEIIPLALSNADGMSRLFANTAVDVTASLSPDVSVSDDSPTQRSFIVPTRRGDGVVAELGIGPIALIKIDVEGFELEVIEGLADTISRFAPAIVFEVLTNRVWGRLIEDAEARQRRQAKANQLSARLDALDYAVFRIDDLGAEHPVTQFDLDAELPAHFSNDGRDYVARPRAPRPVPGSAVT